MDQRLAIVECPVDVSTLSGSFVKVDSEPSGTSDVQATSVTWRTLADLPNEQKRRLLEDDSSQLAGGQKGHKLAQDDVCSSLASDIASVAVAETSGRQGTGLLVASSPSHELDRMQEPQPLLELGGVPLACHALWQLNAAKFSLVVIVLGCQGREVRESLQDYLIQESDVFNGLRVKFVDLGEGWRGGRVAAIAAAQRVLQKELHGTGSFVIVGADHIFDASLLEEAAAVDLNSAKTCDEACVLVETDLEGMRGLPQSTVYCALRPLQGPDRIYSIGSDIGTYAGIEAGLLVCNLPLLQRFVELTHADGQMNVRVSAILSECAKRGRLRMMKTNGRTWFSVETVESAEFTGENLRSCGQKYTLAGGREVNLVGLPKKTQTSPVDGGEWAEFTVEKWRSAVYVAKSFFSELFVDTTDFVAMLCDELGGVGERGPVLVEVGCGTGEALQPFFSSVGGSKPLAKYTCGMDFNPHFIEFCQQNVAADDQHSVHHFVGDAQELVSLVHNKLPVEWGVVNRPKIVMCVGNTVGIMPPEVRVNVYQQMKELAGIDGYMVVVFWNGNRFGDAVQNFYHNNPQLCGAFTGECIDLDTCTLATPSGYRTHWTKPKEARQIFEDEIGVEVVKLVEKGNGVLIAGRMRG